MFEKESQQKNGRQCGALRAQSRGGELPSKWGVKKVKDAIGSQMAGNRVRNVPYRVATSAHELKKKKGGEGKKKKKNPKVWNNGLPYPVRRQSGAESRWSGGPVNVFELMKSSRC